jgi:hypothetical protein
MKLTLVENQDLDPFETAKSKDLQTVVFIGNQNVVLHQKVEIGVLNRDTWYVASTSTEDDPTFVDCQRGTKFDTAYNTHFRSGCYGLLTEIQDPEDGHWLNGDYADNDRLEGWFAGFGEDLVAIIELPTGPTYSFLQAY